jgi:hypothetical protein
VHEPARETLVDHETDVLVVGGGPAGCAAAVAARRVGADVTLVERYNHLGGLSTGGLVIWIDRMTDWSGERVIEGFAAEILDRLPPDAIAGAPKELWGRKDSASVERWRGRQGAFRNTVTWSPMIDPEWLKLVSLDLVGESGVSLLLHSWAVATLVDGSTVRGVVFEGKQGRRAILAKVVVDTTGDLDVCAGSGTPYDSDFETEGNNVQHCINTSWTWAGVDFERWLVFKRDEPEAYAALLRQGAAELGYVETPVVGWRDDVALFMGPRLSGYDALDVADLTDAELESRRRMVAHLGFFRRHAPGFEHVWLLSAAPQIGVRHTRRALGDHRMSRDEWKAGLQHDDEIGVSPSPSEKFPNVSVPYRSLVVAGLDNVLVGGRHIATDPSTHAFMREIPQCWLTGQAAGAAAAMAALGGSEPRGIAVRELQHVLREQGAYVRAPAAV